MPLDAQDDPDAQMPMPFAAAELYAQQVMRWAREGNYSHLKVQRDVPYGENRLQRCDVFSPHQATACPVLIFWHGGGWTNGYRHYVHFMAEQVCALGIALVAPSYRLAPLHKLPLAYADALACFEFVREHAPSWGVDPARIVLSGHSAGGHLAALVALRGLRDQPKAIRACLPISAILDLHHPDPAPGSLEERVYSMLLSDPSHDALMSPLCWTAGNSIPLHLSFGEHDSVRVRISNRRMHSLLEAQNSPVTMQEQANLSHFDTHTMLRDASEPWYQHLQAFATA